MQVGVTAAADPADPRLPARCPRCGARVGGAVAWCTLCHADLRPAPVLPPVPSPSCAVTGGDGRPGRHARLATAHPAPAVPTPHPEEPWRRWAARLHSPRARILAMVGGLAACTLLLLGLATLAGLLLPG